MTDLLDHTDDSPDTGDRARLRRRLLIGVVAVIAILAGALWWFFLRDDSPARLDIDDATSALDDGATDEPDAATADTDTGATEGGDVTGVWTVDPTLGAEAGGTTAGYRVGEELSTIGVTEAVGRTDQVEGNVVIEGTTVTDAEITVDMASIESDESRRDGRYRSAMRTDEFPTSTFVLTEPIELGAVPADGETISVAAIGDMTIAGTTNPVTVDLDASLVDDVLVIVGSLNVVFDDYGVEEPSAVIVVSIEDNADIEFQLFLTR